MVTVVVVVAAPGGYHRCWRWWSFRVRLLLGLMLLWLPLRDSTCTLRGRPGATSWLAGGSALLLLSSAKPSVSLLWLGVVGEIQATGDLRATHLAKAIRITSATGVGMDGIIYIEEWKFLRPLRPFL